MVAHWAVSGPSKYSKRMFVLWSCSSKFVSYFVTSIIKFRKKTKNHDLCVKMQGCYRFKVSKCSKVFVCARTSVGVKYFWFASGGSLYMMCDGWRYVRACYDNGFSGTTCFIMLRLEVLYAFIKKWQA